LDWEATFPSTSGPPGWPSASPGCAWGHPHGQNTSICHTGCFSFHPDQKILSSEKNIFWFGLGGFSSGAQRFKQSCKSCILCRHVFENKNSLFA
jgi:hypothetical protein